MTVLSCLGQDPGDVKDANEIVVLNPLTLRAAKRGLTILDIFL